MVFNQRRINQMNIEKAKQVYKESEDSRNLLLSIFTKEELGISILPSQEEFNKFFEEEILSKVDPAKTRFPRKNSFSCIQLCNSRGEWLLGYDYNPKRPYFYYQFDRTCIILRDKFSLSDVDTKRLLRSLIESHFNLKVAQQDICIFRTNPD
jgi:hypothetical protein